jgi:hypothetical protein
MNFFGGKGVKKNAFIGPILRGCAHPGYLKKHAKSQLKACTTNKTCKRVKGVKGAHCEIKKTRGRPKRRIISGTELFGKSPKKTKAKKASPSRMKTRSGMVKSARKSSRLMEKRRLKARKLYGF